ncbi:hypothetical protein POPTR_001G393000v4 [Populus trichocarpa]|uniref:Uncharacterized protein n=1 Tax=Populus trichocarpa TaxID=3694 RepID=A0ACC0TPF6_POPTR|nr:hypothetical protein POPTR_001G393000v4 [Populus trichocarpa]
MERKLKIGTIHPDLGIGGAERLIVDAAVELASLGHNVHVLTAHHDKNRCLEETVAGKLRLFAYLRCIFVALCVLFLWPSFDVILAHRVVFYCHFPDLLLAQHTTVLWRLYRKPIDFIEEITTGMADMILVNSKFTASMFTNTFKHLHAREIQPAVLYPAVNMDQFDVPHSYNSSESYSYLFHVEKNIELTVSAFARLHTLAEHALQSQSLTEATLTIAGGYDNRLRENVEYLMEPRRLAERERVSHRVNFITSCSTAERNKLLSQCLMNTLEAVAAHKPVIACNSGGPVETVKDGETGFLCNPTPEEFSLAMAKLIQDPQMASRMGGRGPEACC